MQLSNMYSFLFVDELFVGNLQENFSSDKSAQIRNSRASSIIIFHFEQQSFSKSENDCQVNDKHPANLSRRVDSKAPNKAPDAPNDMA